MQQGTTRRQRADGAATREKILQAASRLLSRRGFANVTCRDIAARAHVDLASINYHFGSRRGLFAAALIAAHHDLFQIEEMRKIVDSPQPADQKVKGMLRMILQQASGENGWKMKLLFRGLLDEEASLRPLFDTEVLPKFALVQRLASEVSGIPENDPALKRCMFCVISPVFTLLAFGKSLPNNLYSLQKDTPEEAAEFIGRYMTDWLREEGRRWKEAGRAKEASAAEVIRHGGHESAGPLAA
ncbi:MAG: CerR family C-terminal domain-containing protein [Mesosutterella sp.]|nr:CerR family C-terminal domain-containing protein [Mesosutterella sp.]